jgi:PTH2 family peptidyl-tRNA hydrolase
MSDGSLLGWTFLSFVLGALSTTLGRDSDNRVSNASKDMERESMRDKAASDVVKSNDKGSSKPVEPENASQDDEDLTDKPRPKESASDDSEDEEYTSDDSDSGSEEGSEDEDECKMVLVLRNDLPQLSKTKAASHCAQATLANFKACLASLELKDTLETWEMHGQAKITLKCPDEEEL